MTFKIKKQIGLTTIPKYFLEDKELSIVAKGILGVLYHHGDLLPFVKEDRDSLKPYVMELVEKGYIKNENGILEVQNKPINFRKKNTTVSLEPNKKETLFDYMIKEVSNYTNDVELQNVLKEYFTARMSKQSGTRFANFHFSKQSIKPLLDELNNLGDKVNAVRLALKHQYSGFKYITLSKGDNAISNRASKDEILDARRRLKEGDGF